MNTHVYVHVCIGSYRLFTTNSSDELQLQAERQKVANAGRHRGVVLVAVSAMASVAQRAQNISRVARDRQGTHLDIMWPQYTNVILNIYQVSDTNATRTLAFMRPPTLT